MSARIGRRSGKFLFFVSPLFVPPFLSVTSGSGIDLYICRESINMRGIPARTYLKEKAYKDAIPEFKATLTDIGKKQGWTLNELQARFSNELWDYIIYQ